MRRLKQVWLFADTISLIDKNMNNGQSRASFMDKIIKNGLWYEKNVLVEIVADNKMIHHPGRPKRALL